MTLPDTPAIPSSKKTRTLGWLLAAMMVLVAAFLYFGNRFNLTYELAVRRKMPHGEKAVFSNIQRFKSGAVCGTVESVDGVQRFIVTRDEVALLEGSALVTAAAFNAAREKTCRD